MQLNFRVWDIAQKQMVYFNFADIRRAQFFDQPSHQYVWPENVLLKPAKITETLNPVMRGSGLNDINGKEIFEGDLVSGHYFGFDGRGETDNSFKRGKVVYSEWACFGIQIEDNDCWLDFSQTSHFEEPCLEIIGNIYENP